MDQRRQQLVQDLMLVIVSVCIAVLLTITGVAEKFVLSLNNFSWSGMILAGIFFTSIFTVAPSIVLIGGFAQASYLPVLAILGGVGAVVGDYIIFRFVKDRVSEDFKYLFSISRRQRIRAILNTRVFRFLVPFLGAIIIASPLPDEIGVTLLGMSKVKYGLFFPLTFVLNGAGILFIGWLARAII
ncbi:MAG: hypothetical protein A3G59_00530 [Candidatus Taylorbacteria bacterium RIFCSPLOWO2_12_FULL_47_20]|uniref:TVP38/TMEM64 family membrane protein n=2 Tax=Candidatus Tayloriibacteriota TaxID=1817919 RepID=A0A1G2P4E0_9BACT|nr:MAG: hypothetical protein A3H68_01925 [Candidatus Taylorbacteria bacterium RIFCSPLOWO2_02_FULL_46_40]OHA43227.1 MAG: hypothetical protein A3G59_00530 [Candidatus Taylorbacteria bacterium RIFCSPLOWO2_12_FULL_47_20]